MCSAVKVTCEWSKVSPPGYPLIVPTIDKVTGAYPVEGLVAKKI